jgi:hypothetical protein
MQLELGLREGTDPSVPGWDELDPEARRVCVHALARVIAKAVWRAANPEEEGQPDD